MSENGEQLEWPRPNPTALSRPFWDAANEKRFVLQQCGACTKYRWTPQVLCPHCLADETTWVEASGEGVVYSYTVVHRPPLPAFKAPYVLAVVQLKEGPLMLTHMVDTSPDEIKVDDPVKVAFTRLDDQINLYTFKRA
jgi:uncharacterized OB-fold protein